MQRLSLVRNTRSVSDKLRSSISCVDGERMKHLKKIMLGALLLAAAPLVGQAKNVPPGRQPKSKAVHVVHSDHGQQVFEQNCSRCHNAPEGFPPQISGTIAMHMRVRAGLSQADYKALLRFLNP